MADGSPGVQFANSIATDLAPLLALFGEDFAKQYISDSSTLLDHIIFAMAPIGILTAVISAIRVAAPDAIRAIIGKAREDRASAEAELMSSTSDEVSELYDGRSMVKTTGDVQIKEIVLVQGAFQQHPNELGLYTLKDANERNLLGEASHEDRVMHIIKGFTGKMLQYKNKIVFPGRRLNTSLNGSYVDVENIPSNTSRNGNCQDGGWTSSSRSLSGSRMDKENVSNHPPSSIRLELPDFPPNISLNLQPRASKGYLWFAAVLGILLQLAVLVFSALITYLPSLSPNFDTNSGPAPSYAFPTFAVGTVVLIYGMFLCSFVIDSSTKERHWNFKVKDKPAKIKIMWLQKRYFGNSQLFDSYIITQANNNLTELHTSWRQESNKKSSKNRYFLNWTGREYVAVVGAAAGLLGFLGQFEGLRGMNWAASVSQLCAIFIMLIIRSLMHRNLEEQVTVEKPQDNHEMDKLAIQLSIENNWPDSFPDHELPKNKTKGTSTSLDSNSEPESPPWTVLSGIDTIARRGKFIIKTPEEPKKPKKKKTTRRATPSITAIRALTSSDDLRVKRPELIEKNLDTKTELETHAQKVMNIRARLSQLTGWKSATTVAAEMVESAIFCLIRELPSSHGDRDFCWRLDVRVKPDPEPQHVELIIPWQENEASENRRIPLVCQIEAILSLWYHCWTDPKIPASTPFPAVRILGKASQLLIRDLRSWGVRDDEFQASTISDIDKSKLIVGVLRGNNQSKGLYCFERNNNLPLLLAQHLFTAFMWALADHVPFSAFTSSDTTIDRAEYVETIRPWTAYTLKNIRLSRIVNTLSKIGLGSSEELYMMIIPPLSYARKLPSEIIVDHFLDYTENARNAGEHNLYLEAAVAHIELLKYCRLFSFRCSDRFLLKAGAAVLELVKLLDDRIDGEVPNERESIEALKFQRSELMKMLKTISPKSRAILIKLYQFQRRKEYETLLEEASSKDLKVWTEALAKRVDVHNLFAHTEMHKYVLKHRDEDPAEDSSSDSPTGLTLNISIGHEGAVPDILGWTPLHYANGQKYRPDLVKHALYEGDSDSRKTLVRGRPNQTAMGGVTALHMMAVHGSAPLAEVLLFNKIIPVQDKSRPLLLAAESGENSIVSLLLDNMILDITKVKDHLKRTPLHLAAKGGHLKVITALMNHKSVNQKTFREAVNQKDFRDRTPLHFAAGLAPEQDSAREILGSLVEGQLAKGGAKDGAKEGTKDGTKPDPTAPEINLNAADACGFTPLHFAVAANNTGAVTLLVEKKADLSLCTNLGQGQWTPLDLAVKLKREEVVAILLSPPGDGGSTSSRVIVPGDYTPFYLAVDVGCIGILEQLLRNLNLFLPADNQTQDSSSKSNRKSDLKTTLMNELLAYTAARSTKNVDQIISELCGNGAKLNSTFLGLTPLKWAAKHNNLDAAKAILKRYDGDLQIAAESMNPPYSPILPLLHYAVLSSKPDEPDVFKLLLNTDIPAYQTGPYGNTLQVACLRYDPLIVQDLLDRAGFGANVQLREILDEHGWSAFSEMKSIGRVRDQDLEAFKTAAPNQIFLDLLDGAGFGANVQLRETLDEHSWSAFSEMKSIGRVRDQDLKAFKTAAPNQKISELPRPQAWDKSMKSDALTIKDEHGLVVQYISKEMGVVGAIRADHPIPPTTGKFSFEITIEEGSDTGRISIGLAAGIVSMSALPGFDEDYNKNLVQDREAKESPSRLSITAWPSDSTSFTWGYDGKFEGGDRIRCIYDYSEGKATIKWELNGFEDGDVFPIHTGKKLYPVVGMEFPGACIRTSFEARILQAAPSPLSSKEPSPSVSRDRSPPLSSDRSPPLSRGRSPPLSRDRSPPLSRDQSPLQSRDPSPSPRILMRRPKPRRLDSPYQDSDGEPWGLEFAAEMSDSVWSEN